MALWSQAQGLYGKAINSPIATAWKRWGRFAWAAPFVAADISISKDKTAAISASTASFGVAWALRNRKGALPFILPSIAYAVTRPFVSVATGKYELRGGTRMGQKIASEIIIGRPNDPINPIKGHDAGHWGRDQVFASGDFEPGRSWKGLLAEKGFELAQSTRERSPVDQGNLPSDTKKRFEHFTEKLETEGIDVGALRDRIIIPKTAFTESELTGTLGFVPVRVSVPEAGQISATSFRHEKNLYHIHEHEKNWTMHEDVRVSSTMLMQDKSLSLFGKIGAFTRGLPHLITEGVPGMYHYIRGKLSGAKPIVERIQEIAFGFFQERNKPVNPIKGHDAGHWGRETAFASGDFEPGSSWKGLWRGLRKGIKSIWSGTRAVGRGIVALPGMTKRSLKVTTTLLGESARETRHFLKKEFIPGLKKGRLPEVGLAAAIAAEPALAIFGLMTPTVASMTAFTLLGKGGYMAIKRGKDLLNIAKFTRKNPELSKAVMKHVGGGTMRQVGSYIRHGTKNPAGMFIELGGGKLGRESLKADFSMTMQELMKDPSKISQMGGFDDIYNTLRGLSDGPGIQEIRKLLGIPFGSGWKGIFGALRSPIRSFKAWRAGRQFTKGVARAVPLYESLGRRAAAEVGIRSPTVKVYESGGTIGMEAFGPKGESLFSTVRGFEPGAIDFMDITVSPLLQKKGIAGFLQKSELGIFRRMGYKEGTLMQATVVHPATAKMHLQLYGGKIQYAGLQETLEQELMKVGKWKPKAATFEKRVLAGEYTAEQFIGGATVGRLPSSQAINKIVGHDMRWGRDWVQKVLGTDFIPGSSWKGLSSIKRFFRGLKPRTLAGDMAVSRLGIGLQEAYWAGETARLEKIVGSAGTFGVKAAAGEARIAKLDAAWQKKIGGAGDTLPPGHGVRKPLMAPEEIELWNKMSITRGSSWAGEVAPIPVAISAPIPVPVGKVLGPSGHPYAIPMGAPKGGLEKMIQLGALPTAPPAIEASNMVKKILSPQIAKRKYILNKLQEGAQPLPFQLNAKRRTSHGVDRGSRSK